MKRLMLISLLIAFSLAADAQDRKDKVISLSAALEAGLPIGRFADSHGFGIGAALQGAYCLTDRACLTLGAGYLTYPGKTLDSGILSKKYDAFNTAPLMAGLQYGLTDKIYAQGQVGISFLSADDSGQSEFTWSLGLGYKITGRIDLGIKYISIATPADPTRSMGFRIAYNF